MQVRLVRATGEDDFVCDAGGNGREIDRCPMVSDTYVETPRWMTFQNETNGFDQTDYLQRCDHSSVRNLQGKFVRAVDGFSD